MLSLSSEKDDFFPCVLRGDCRSFSFLADISALSLQLLWENNVSYPLSLLNWMGRWREWGICMYPQGHGKGIVPWHHLEWPPSSSLRDHRFTSRGWWWRRRRQRRSYGSTQWERAPVYASVTGKDDEEQLCLVCTPYMERGKGASVCQRDFSHTKDHEAPLYTPSKSLNQ